MIRNLAQCPYCGDCEIALDDHPSLVFNPAGSSSPCGHLAWVEGRYSQWDLSPQGINRAIGSTEFRSVTVVGPDLGTADAYATAAFAMGAAGPAWTAGLVGYEAMTVIGERVLSTPGFAALCGGSVSAGLRPPAGSRRPTRARCPA